MHAKLLTISVYLLMLAPRAAPADGADGKVYDGTHRAETIYHPAAWTHGFSYCGEQLEEGQDYIFQRTTKATGLERLKAAFHELAYQAEGKRAECPRQADVQKIFQRFDVEAKAVREGILTSSAAVACATANEPQDSRREAAVRTSGLIAGIESANEIMLRDLRRVSEGDLKGLIDGTLRDTQDNIDALSDCDRYLFFDYLLAESLSCELYRTKFRFDLLVRVSGKGDYLAFLCYNDDPSAHDAAAPKKPKELPSDITGLQGH